MKKVSKKIAFVSFKGGVAKTSSSVNFAAGIKLHYPDAKILIVDTDPQANIRSYFKLKLEGKADLAALLVEGPESFSTEGLHQVPAYLPNQGKQETIDVFLTSKRLGALESELSSKGIRRQDELMKLRFEQTGLNTAYDFIVVDTSPYMGLMNVNVFTFVDYLVIPVNLDSFTVATIDSVVSNLNALKEFYPTIPKILGILPTRLDRRSEVEKQSLQHIKEKYAGKLHVFEPIGQDAGVKRAAARKQFIFDLNVRASEHYEIFTNQVLELLNGEENQVQANI